MNAQKIDRYLERIGLKRQDPDEVFLRDLQWHHLLEVPYENIDMYRGIPLRFETDDLYEKIVGRRRGGVCFELNFLFGDLLRGLGYTVRSVSAYVPSGTRNPMEHALSLVTVGDREWVADVGFQTGFRTPLQMTDSVQNDGRRDYRIEKMEGAYRIRHRRPDGRWGDDYVFTREERTREQHRAICNWFCTAPESKYHKGLYCFRETPGGRVAFQKDELVIQNYGRSETRKVQTEPERREMLRRIFGLEPGEGPV